MTPTCDKCGKEKCRQTDHNPSTYCFPFGQSSPFCHGCPQEEADKSVTISHTVTGNGVVLNTPAHTYGDPANLPKVSSIGSDRCWGCQIAIPKDEIHYCDPNDKTMPGSTSSTGGDATGIDYPLPTFPACGTGKLTLVTGGGERCDICQCLHCNKNGYSECKDCSCPAGRSIPPSTEGESGYNQKAETQAAPQCWYGSFGYGQRCSCGRNLVKYYAKLWGTYQECREMMYDRWGAKWCSLYDGGTGGYLQCPAWLDEFGIELLPQNCWDRTCHPASRETYEI